MNESDQRPPVWVGHVALHSERVAETRDFMQKLGMRIVAGNDEFAVLEMRGGTHLVVTSDSESTLLRGSFDLMVDDLDAVHAELGVWGLSPSAIERGSIHDSFSVQVPGSASIVFNSSHVGDLPV